MTGIRDRLPAVAAGPPSPRAMARAGGLPPSGVFILMAGAFMPQADFFITNVALPTIDRSLHASPGTLELIVAGYGVAYAAVLVLGGRLGDRIGRRRLFQIGAVGFVAASALCGLSPDIWVLVAARVIQGIFAAMLVPQVLATFQATLDGGRKTRALALYGATSGLAAVVGQIAGGVLVTADILGSSWRAIFLINVPIGIAVLVVARYVVPATRSDRPTGIDVPGTLAFAATLVALLVPLAEGDSLHWPVWGWVLIAVAVMLGAVTFLIERHSERSGHTPLLPPSLLRLPSMARGLALYLAFSVGFGAFLFVFALTVQDGLHASALVSGLAVVPMAGLFLVGVVLSPKIINRFGRAAIAGGAIVQVAGLALVIIVILAGWPHVAIIDFIGPFVLLGAGQSMMVTGLFRVVLVDVPAYQAGIGSGVLITMQQAGLALGVAILGSIYLSLAPHSIRAGFVTAVGIQLGIGVLFAIGSRFLPRFTATANLRRDRVLLGEAGELGEERGAAGGGPGQAGFRGLDVADPEVADTGAGVHAGRGFWQDDDAAADGDLLEFLLDGVGEPGWREPAAAAHLGGDVAPLGHDVRVLQQVLVGEVADADVFLPGQAVPRGQHRQLRLAGQGTQLEPVLVDWQPDVADVGPPVVQHLRLVGPVGAQHLDGELGVRGGEGPHGVGDDQPRHERDGELAGLAGGLGDAPAQGFGVGEQRLGVGRELRSRRGEHRPAPAPDEQHGAELGLQGADLAGQDGLGDVQVLGGAAEVAAAGHGHEVADLAQVDVHLGPPPVSRAS